MIQCQSEIPLSKEQRRKQPSVQTQQMPQIIEKLRLGRPYHIWDFLFIYQKSRISTNYNSLILKRDKHFAIQQFMKAPSMNSIYSDDRQFGTH